MRTKIEEVEERRWATRHVRSDREFNDWDNTRHIGKEKEWLMSYWDSRSYSHRSFLLEKIANFSPISSILEVGCNCGPNLYVIAKKFPTAKIRGIDINPMAVQMGNDLLLKEGISNVKLMVGKAYELNRFSDKTFDVVFTYAVLAHIGPSKTKKVVEEMLRVAKKAIIFVEWHDENASDIGTRIGYSHRWKRNYKSLLKQFVSEEKIHLIKIPKELWGGDWGELGYIIEVIL